jgi:hypothetical protein
MSMKNVSKAAILADFVFTNHGSVWLVTPKDSTVRRALAQRVDPNEAQWFGEALAVEARFVEGLALGLREEGFSVKGA